MQSLNVVVPTHAHVIITGAIIIQQFILAKCNTPSKNPDIWTIENPENPDTGYITILITYAISVTKL